MVEIVTVEGPLEPRRLGWIADLYGRADAKYCRPEILDHLFTRSPAGPGLHAFALDEGRPVGHCAVVPMRARCSTRELRCGKLEALFVDESYRGRRSGAEPVVRAMLARLYAVADEQGFDLLHAYVTPRVGRVIGFLPLAGVGEQTLVTVIRPGSRAATAPLAAAQGAVRELAYMLAKGAVRRPGEATLRPLTGDDAELADGAPPPPGRWTLLAEDAWDWYRSSSLLRVLELSGPHGCRALIQVPGSPGEPVRLIGWRPERARLLSAILLLGAVGRVARRSGATTFRFQPWGSPAGNGTLKQACRLLGFVPRNDLTTLWVRTRDPSLARAEAVVPTPLFYLAF
jgi:GNAT superfamily N-acetyltransferase